MGGSGKLRPSDGRVTDQLSEADGMQQPCELTVEFEEAVSTQVGWTPAFPQTPVCQCASLPNNTVRGTLSVPSWLCAM